MLCWLRRGAWMLLLCLWMPGCAPRVEGPLDERNDPYFRAGKERLEARDYKGAIAAFEKALELNPRSALAHYELGVLYEQQEQDYPAAIYHYNRAIKLRPEGYPADNARLLIAGCRQELVKAESLAPVAQGVLRELERLRQENQQLRKQLEAWQALAGRQRQKPPALPSEESHSSLGRPLATNRVPITPAGPVESAKLGASGALSNEPTTGQRSHRVQPGETMASLARQYGIKLNVLMAANPGLEPRRLRVGQSVSIPAP